MPLRFAESPAALLSAAKIEKWLSRCVEDANGCLIWPGRTDYGYASVVVRVLDGRRLHRRLHRIVYEYLVGPIPEGLVIDHVYARGCRSRACCNVAHLEAVTVHENNRRAALHRTPTELKTHCIHGHELTLENTYRYPGRRCCIACQRNRKAKARASRLGAEAR